MEAYQGLSTSMNSDYKELGSENAVVSEYSNAFTLQLKLPYDPYFAKFFISRHLLEKLDNRNLKGNGTSRENRTLKCAPVDNTAMKKQGRATYDY
jgi:hypothetical protein